MAYNRSFRPLSSATTVKNNQLILPVGRRAYLNLPAASGGSTVDFVPFGQERKTLPAEVLCDGQEVEIIGWRPGAAGGVAYQISRISDRREWWAPATCLRVSAAAAVGAK